MNYREALKLAKQSANDPAIRIAGITKENNLVTTKECVDYQKDQNNLKFIVDGRWEHTKEGLTKKRTRVRRVTFKVPTISLKNGYKFAYGTVM